MRVVWYLSDSFACGHVRGIAPAAAVNRSRCGVSVDAKADVVYSDMEGTDVMVFQKCHQQRMLDWMRMAQRRGIRCVYELDDDLFNCPEAFPPLHNEGVRPHEFYGRAEVREVMRAFLDECDAVTVSTPELRNALKTYGVGDVESKTTVILNAVDVPMWRDGFEAHAKRGPWAPSTDGSTPAFIIGWLASGSHNIDAPLIYEGLSAVMEKYAHVKLRLLGWVHAFDGVEALAPYRDRIEASAWVPISSLPPVLATFDFGLAPIIDCPFNLAKSEVKALELAAVGVPCLASPMPCYQRFVDDGVGRMVSPNTPDQWRRELLAAVEAPYEVWRRGISAHAKLMNGWTCDDRAPQWEAFYKAVSGE